MNTVKFRDLVSKVVINKDSKASAVQDILGWLKLTISNGNTKIIIKEGSNNDST